MFRYLRAAFWSAPTLPGLGRVPVNVLAFAGVMILGFGHPGFWLLGIALESAWLFLLTNNLRFQKLVDAEQTQIESGAEDAVRASLLSKLEPDARARHEQLLAKCARIQQLETATQTDDIIMADNREALQKLALLHLNLLGAQQTVQSLDGARAEQELKVKLTAIDRELRAGTLSSVLRESKEATQTLLRQRLANLARRAQTLEEIESDLTRIEAQIDVAVDNAGLRGKSESISANIKLTSQLLDRSGEAPPLADFERSFSSETD